VFLERRPPAGIWGGLWAFPEGRARDRPAAAVRRYGCELIAARRLAALAHGFTHFQLSATPVLCQVRRAGALAESPGRIWMDIADAAAAAVPAPVKRLLHALAR
jgi:A/G-specific adenine glycosylase